MGEWQCKEWQHEEMLKTEDIKSFFRPFPTKDFLALFFYNLVIFWTNSAIFKLMSTLFTKKKHISAIFQIFLILIKENV